MLWKYFKMEQRSSMDDKVSCEAVAVSKDDVGCIPNPPYSSIFSCSSFLVRAKTSKTQSAA